MGTLSILSRVYMVIDSIRPYDLAVEDPTGLTAVLGAAIRSANDRWAAKAAADPSLISMGSTLTALLWSGSHVAVANIGDSRAYLLRNGILRRITEDHVMSKLVAHPMLRLTREAGAPDNATMIVVDVPDGAWTERTDPPAVLGAAATLAEVG